MMSSLLGSAYLHIAFMQINISWNNIQHAQQIQMYLGTGNNANLITGGGKNSKHAYPRQQDKPHRNSHYLQKGQTPPSPIQPNQSYNNNRNKYNGSLNDEEEDNVFPSDFQYVYDHGQDSQEFDGDALNENQIFQIDDCKFSPIANTYIEDNDPPPKYMQDRVLRDTMRPYRSRDQQKIRETRPQSPRWKEFLNPDVQKFYDSIMKNQLQNKSSQQKNSQCLRKPSSQYSHQVQYEAELNEENKQQGKNEKSEKNYAGYKSQKSHNLSVGNERIKQTRNKSTMQNELQASQVDDMKKRYEDKISVLEHQNNNLKDELFYLRAAILAQYEAREHVKASLK